MHTTRTKQLNLLLIKQSLFSLYITLQNYKMRGVYQQIKYVHKHALNQLKILDNFKVSFKW